jgi:hypothetical protein
VQLGASLADGMPTCGYIDICRMLPSIVDLSDISKVIAACAPAQKLLRGGGRLLCKRFLVDLDTFVACETVAALVAARCADLPLIEGQLPSRSYSLPPHQSQGKEQWQAVQPEHTGTGAK